MCVCVCGGASHTIAKLAYVNFNAYVSLYFLHVIYCVSALLPTYFYTHVPASVRNCKMCLATLLEAGR